MASIKEPEFCKLTELSSNQFGTKILFATDEWFAVAKNLLQPEEPIFLAGEFTEFGKWMDGWETRRKRICGHDFCILQLGLSGFIHGVDFDTAFFTGNHAPRISLQGACLDQEPQEFLHLENQVGVMGSCATTKDIEKVLKGNSNNWEEIIPMTELKPGYEETRHNYIEINNKKRYTHLRLNLFPDGGIARLRVYGEIAINWLSIGTSELLDLAAVENGGTAIVWTDSHYGQAKNLLKLGRGVNMGDGWETARKANRPPILIEGKDGLLEVPGNDWVIIKLGTPGRIQKLIIDTLHFKGNSPESCQVEACFYEHEDQKSIQNDLKDMKQWKILLQRRKLKPHHEHIFLTEELKDVGAISHLKLVIYPDGGISRFRAFGFKHI